MNAKNLSAALAEGHNYLRAGKLQDAANIYQSILAAAPEQPEALHHLGIVAYQLGRFQEALPLISKAVSLTPENATIYSNLGLVFEAVGKADLAESAYRYSIHLQPQNPEALYNLGNICKKQGKLSEAIAHYLRASQVRPDAEIWNNLGNAYLEDAQIMQAEAAYRKAIALEPTHAQAHYNLSHALREQGRIAEALAACAEAKRLNPNDGNAFSNFLLMLHYQENDPATLHAHALEWAARFAPENVQMGGLTFDRDPARRLRIGYVSGDFKNHPIGYFMESVLAAHDKKQVEIFCYANQNIVQEITQRLQQSSDHWRNIFDVSDDAAAHIIRDDQIDVLIDLSGHTEGNRLGIFARKPAAIQASWIGYLDTLGMKAMDYIICDGLTIPPQQEKFYTEAPLRLPDSFLCFTPPEIAIAPARGEGPFTFGCFNNIAKITPAMVKIYAEILQKIPHAQFCFKGKQWTDAGVRARFVTLFAEQNIPESRLIFEGVSKRQEYFKTYHQVDIILDTFPYNGGTTTVEALWMGVPVLALAGDTFLSRLGASLLSAVALQDWVAHSAEEYIAKAVEYASNSEALRELRSTLRPRVLASPLCDAPRFARNLEAAYRRAWQAYIHPVK